MKISAIRGYFATANRRSRVLVKVETDEGVSGWGECYALGPEAAVRSALEYLAGWFIGEDPRRIEYLLMRAHQQFRFPPGGIGLAALSGLEHALWDVSGKAAGLPVYLLLGGHVRDRVRVYHSIDGKKSAAAAAESAQAFHAEFGLTAFKFTPWFLDPNQHRWGRVCARAGEFFAELRGLTPPDWEFAFDGHAQIHDPARAVQLADALAPHDPFFLEEPLRPENRAAWARLRAQLRVPLATGECLYGRFEFADLIARSAVDIVQPDIALCGGLAEMRRIAHLAEANYVSVAPHNPMGPIATAANVHFAAATHNFLILEYVRGSNIGVPWAPDPYVPRDGHLELRPDRPGLGVTIDEDALRDTPNVVWSRRAPVRPDGSTGYI